MRAAACGSFGQVEGTLAKFAGRESALFDALVAKYGPEPGAGGSGGGGGICGGGGGGAGASSGAASSAYPPEVGAAPKAFSFSVPKPAGGGAASVGGDASAAPASAPSVPAFSFGAAGSLQAVGSTTGAPSSGLGSATPLFGGSPAAVPAVAEPSCPAGSGGSVSGGGAGAAGRARLVRFYETYNPEKLSEVRVVSGCVTPAGCRLNGFLV